MTANFGLVSIGVGFGVGFTVEFGVGFGVGSTPGSSGEEVGVGEGAGESSFRSPGVGVARLGDTSGVGLLLLTCSEPPRVRIQAIVIPDSPITKTIASIHGNGLRRSASRGLVEATLN